MPKSLSDIWQAGVDAVRGTPAVRAFLPTLPHSPTRILAVGKAACDMAYPTMQAFPGTPTLIVTKHGHATPLPGPATILEAGHPIPDAGSLAGGRALLDAVAACGNTDHLLLLVSGGASATAELLPDGLTLADLQSDTEAMMASGADIHAINARRKEVSLIKGGKLLAQFRGASATTLAISDVEGDSLDVIGSGIGCAPASLKAPFEAHIVASNAIARAACADACDAPVVVNSETLFDDVRVVAETLGQTLRDGPDGIYIFGGEPTVVLPEAPGRGGRNQALALLIAEQIAGMDGIEVLVAGTDGTDGPTPNAGAKVDGSTWQDGAPDALARADAGTYLDTHGALFTTGPTGTNVMDLVIARKT